MPVKGVYSKVIEPTEYVAPMDLDLYLKGETMRYEQSQKKLQELQNQASNVFNIPAYGVDREKLDEYQQKFQAELQSLSGANLKDINTSSKLNNIIKQYASNPEVLNIAQRGYKWQQYQKELSDIKEKGKIVPVWKLKDYKDAENYYSGSEFIADKKFTGNIQEGFDWNKFNKAISDGVDKTSLQTTVGANQQYFEGKTYNNLSTAYKQALQSQPGALEDLQQQFEYYYGNQDWATKDKQLAIEQYQQALYMAANGNTEDIRQQAAQLAQYWQQQASKTNNNMSKEQAFENFILANVDDFASAHTTYALKDTKMGEQAKLTQTFNQQKSLQNDRQAFQARENQLNRDAALNVAGIKQQYSGKNPEEKERYDLKEEMRKSGINPYKEDGTEYSIQEMSSMIANHNAIMGNKSIPYNDYNYSLSEIEGKLQSTSEDVRTEAAKALLKFTTNWDESVEPEIKDGEITYEPSDYDWSFSNPTVNIYGLLEIAKKRVRYSVNNTNNTIAEPNTQNTVQQDATRVNNTVGAVTPTGLKTSAPENKVDVTKVDVKQGKSVFKE